eukprot:14858670-Alexandrium_andersonii.AAC.2
MGGAMRSVVQAAREPVVIARDVALELCQIGIYPKGRWPRTDNAEFGHQAMELRDQAEEDTRTGN